MAEIRIEQKSSKGWLWALLALAVIAALVWWFLANSRVTTTRTAADGEVAPAPAAAPVAQPAAPATDAATPGAPVARYLAWVDLTDARTHAGLDHEYVSSGITRLAGAIADVSVRDSLAGSPVAMQVQALNRLAAQVQQDASSLSHADLVRAAFTSSAALLGDIQRRRFPGAAGAVADARAAAEAVDKHRPLLEQKPQMTRFFRRAAAAVRAMS